jgi:hypothetical protein
MKKRQKFCVIVFVVVMLMGVSIFYLMNSNFCFINSNKNGLTESEAISLLKAAYPEFKTYPNDKLPPQSIRTKQASNGWYVAFVQEGSGRPILEAKCFLVRDDKTIASIGVYAPKVDEDSLDDLSGTNIFNLWIK